MKIAIINGSVRKGNTWTAIHAFMECARGKNEITLIQPDKLQIAPCKGCGACQCYKGCVDQDDTNPTIDKIADADMIVFATPVYWWGMTAQIKGLGFSSTAQYYAIKDLEEARAYMQNPLLRVHLLEIFGALLKLDSCDPEAVMGYPDDMKLKSCMTLFEAVEPTESVFGEVLWRKAGSKDIGSYAKTIRSIRLWKTEQS